MRRSLVLFVPAVVIGALLTITPEHDHSPSPATPRPTPAATAVAPDQAFQDWGNGGGYDLMSALTVELNEITFDLRVGDTVALNTEAGVLYTLASNGSLVGSIPDQVMEDYWEVALQDYSDAALMLMDGDLSGSSDKIHDASVSLDLMNDRLNDLGVTV